jgi:hypothetical protein
LIYKLLLNIAHVLKNFALYIAFLFFYIMPCFQAEAKWQSPNNLEILNTEADEFAPVWNSFENRLYFNSTNSGISKFYVSSLSDSFKLTPPELLQSDLNQSGKNVSYISFITENKAVVSAFKLYPKRSYLNIFKTNRVKKNWLNPIPDDSLATADFSAHPAVSPDGSMLAFSSNRNSPEGTTDIWIAFRQLNGDWSNAVPMKEINSSGNEITPFFATNDTLYFASDGHEGPGGYDIYYTVRIDGIWQKPFPVTELNTEYDESDLTIIPGGAAVFSSNRPRGKGNLDLYIALPENPKPKKTESLSEDALKMAVQRDFINITTNYYNEVLPVIPYYSFYIGYDSLKKGFFPANFALEHQKRFDSLFFNSLRNLSEKIKNNSKSGLKISVIVKLPGSISVDNSLKNLFRDYLKNYLKQNLNTENFEFKEFKYLYTNSGDRIDFELLFDSDNPAFLEPDKIISGNFEITVEPSSLEIGLLTRSMDKLKNWTCNLYFNNTKKEAVKTGNDFTSNIILDFTPFKNLLLSSDSLIIEIKAEDNNKTSISCKYTVSFSKSENYFIKKRLMDSKKFEDYYLFYSNDFYPLSLNDCTDRLINIVQAGAKSVNICFFNPENKSAAEEIGLGLNKRFMNRIPLQTEYIKFNDELPFSTGLKGFYFRIEIEK